MNKNNGYIDPNYFYLQGYYYRVRTIEQISNRLQAALDYRQRLHEKYWYPWYAQAEALKGFWGVNREGVRECIEASDRGYTTHVVNDSTQLFIQTTPPEELPPLMVEKRYKDYIPLITKILKGEVPSFPLRQDLMDEHERLDVLYSHINRVTGYYREFLKTYVEKKHYLKSHRELRLYNEILYVMTVGKYQYHYICTRQGAKLVDDVDLITVKPEEKMGD